MTLDLIGNQTDDIIIPILDDMLAEGYETFGGKLQVESQSLNLSYFESEIRIEIIDDEGIKADKLQVFKYCFLNQLKEFVGTCLQVANAVLTLFAKSAQMEEAYRAASVEKGFVETGSFVLVRISYKAFPT